MNNTSQILRDVVESTNVELSFSNFTISIRHAVKECKLMKFQDMACMCVLFSERIHISNSIAWWRFCELKFNLRFCRSVEFHYNTLNLTTTYLCVVWNVHCDIKSVYYIPFHDIIKNPKLVVHLVRLRSPRLTNESIRRMLWIDEWGKKRHNNNKSNTSIGTGIMEVLVC